MKQPILSLSRPHPMAGRTRRQRLIGEVFAGLLGLMLGALLTLVAAPAHADVPTGGAAPAGAPPS